MTAGAAFASGTPRLQPITRQTLPLLARKYHENHLQRNIEQVCISFTIQRVFYNGGM
jgi:hypothetical protein